MKVRFLLTSELIQELNKGNIKTVDMIKFLLEQKEVTTLNNEVNNTCLSDLIANGYKVINGAIDTFTNEIELTLSNYKLVENIKTCSACLVHDFKNNRGYTVLIDNNNNVYLTISNNNINYDNKGNLVKGLLISNNKSMFSLLSSNYCIEAIEYLFNENDIKEFNQIKKDFHFKIDPSTDKEYIKFVKNNIINKVS